MRHLFAPQAKDQYGNAVEGVVYQVFPWDAAATYFSQAGDGTWTFTAGSAPAPASVFTSNDPADTTVASVADRTSIVDGSLKRLYLDDGIYTVVGTAGTRHFVWPKVTLGAVDRLPALGTSIPAGQTITQVLGTIVTRLEALEAKEVTGQYLGTEATFTALSALDPNGDRSAGDWADLSADDNVSAGGPYLAGRYKVEPDGTTFVFNRAYGEASVNEVIFGSGAPVGAPPVGAQSYTDTQSGKEYWNNAGAWDPVQSSADDSTMTFTL